MSGQGAEVRLDADGWPLFDDTLDGSGPTGDSFRGGNAGGEGASAPDDASGSRSLSEQREHDDAFANFASAGVSAFGGDGHGGFRSIPHDHVPPPEDDAAAVPETLPEDDDTTATEAPTSPIGPMPDLRDRDPYDRPLPPPRGGMSDRGSPGRYRDRGPSHGDRREDRMRDGGRDERSRDDRSRDDRSRDDRSRDGGREGGRAAPRRAERPEMHGVHHFFSPERLDECQKAIGYHFRDIGFLENALTHSSIKSEHRPSYERLEFLGDSVVGLVIAAYLYDHLPEFDEGELTKVKSMVVSTDGLANAAIAVGLDRYLAMGRGLLMKGAIPRSLIADVFEGVVGAVYLDRGFDAARLYVLDHLLPYVKKALGGDGERNFKSVLQQIAQRDLGQTPHYDVVRESNADGQRVFEVSAVLGRRRFPAGRAVTKKEAEQSAAKIAIQLILLEKNSSPRRSRR